MESSEQDPFGINMDDWIDLILGEELGSLLLETARCQEKARSLSLDLS